MSESSSVKSITSARFNLSGPSGTTSSFSPSFSLRFGAAVSSFFFAGLAVTTFADSLRFTGCKPRLSNVLSASGRSEASISPVATVPLVERAL